MITITFLILGILTSLLFPPYFFYPLGFVVIPLLCYLIGHKLYKVKILKKLLYIFIYSIGFFGNLLLWIQNPFFVFEETSNIFFLSVILIILISLIFSSVFILIIYYNKILPLFYILPIIFITFEIIISIIFYGFPWITFSLIIADISFFNYFLKNFGTIITSYFVLQIFCLPYLFIY